MGAPAPGQGEGARRCAGDTGFLTEEGGEGRRHEEVTPESGAGRTVTPAEAGGAGQEEGGSAWPGIGKRGPQGPACPDEEPAAQ